MRRLLERQAKGYGADELVKEILRYFETKGAERAAGFPPGMSLSCALGSTEYHESAENVC